MKIIVISIFMLTHFSACYFNPIVNGILVPDEKASDSSLGLLALGVSSVDEASLQIVGQIKNTNGSNLVNPAITLLSSGSQNSRSLSTSVTANANGKFILKLRPGLFVFNVSSSGGTSLGSFTLNISLPNSVVSTMSSNAQFQIKDLVVFSLNENIVIDETETTSPTISSTMPTDGTMSHPMIYNNTYFYYDTFIVVYFSEEIESTTLSSTNVTVNPAASLEIYPSTNFVSITIANSSGGTNYTLSFGNGILDKAGNGLVPSTLSFSTNNP